MNQTKSNQIKGLAHTLETEPKKKLSYLFFIHLTSFESSQVMEKPNENVQIDSTHHLSSLLFSNDKFGN